MERRFDRQIEKLRTRLIKMCSIVDEQLDFAIRAVEENDAEIANLIIEQDRKVNKHDVKVDKFCQKLLALNQPVAMDLRFIMAALTINHNLERMGDLSKNIAFASRDIKRRPLFFDEIDFAATANIAKEMAKNSIDSFIQNDSKLAMQTILMDDKLDDEVKKADGRIKSILKKDKGNVDDALNYYAIFHHLERLGDCAVNIAKDVYFIVEAEIIKHKSENGKEND